MVVETLLYSALGGVIRGAIGIKKAMDSGEKPDYKYYVFSIALSGVLGTAGILLVSGIGALGTVTGPAAALAGFTGIDVAESLYEMYSKK